MLAAAAAVAFVVEWSDTSHAEFATYAEAAAAGEVQRGWLPSFVPPSARKIEETHNIATNYQWLSFVAPPADLEQAFAHLQTISVPEVRALGIKHSWFAPTHPPELDKYQFATPARSLRAYKQFANPWNLCVVADSSTGETFVWSCEYNRRLTQRSN